jgi:hypothetical protein
MTKQEILNEIDDKGLFWCHKSPDIDLDFIDELEAEGLIETITSAGINFMNGDYCYTRKGNPQALSVKVKDNESWIGK